jgi:hypothetical protein
MIWRSFESEWVKLRRRRLWYGSYIAITGVVLLTTIVTIAGALHHADDRGDLTLAQLAHATGLSQGLMQSGVLLGAVSFSIAAFHSVANSATEHCATSSCANRAGPCS